MLRDVDEEAVDDVEEEFEQGVQDDEEVEMLVADARWSEEEKSGSERDLDCHLKRKPFKCSVSDCNNRFGSKAHLANHTARIPGVSIISKN